MYPSVLEIRITTISKYAIPRKSKARPFSGRASIILESLTEIHRGELVFPVYYFRLPNPD